ncbi:hypothetical protein B0H13DRAFT_1888466 [Mycena leptocephala]|nr:hypothetical protein B0H13DRAFT_1888466 [Mycena leptocephala]
MPRFCWKCGAPPTNPLALHPDPPSTNPSLDLTRLLTTNDVPPDSEVPVIQDIVSEGQKWLDTLDVQIEALHTSIAELLQMRDGKAEHVRQHRAIISPIRRVPQELVCEILALTLSRDKRDEDRALQPPWYLGHICRSWRHAALSFGSLWSSITIPSSLSPNDSRILAATEAQLLRTGNASLDMGWFDVQDDINPRLLDIVLPHCSRWRRLCIHVTPLYEEPQLSWLYPVDGRLHRLEQLEVISTRDTFIPDVFLNAPKLREIILTDEIIYPHRPSPTSIMLPWGQITHYRGTYPAAVHLTYLSAAPNLLECVAGITTFDDFHPGYSLDPTVVTPCLRRLCVEEDRFLLRLTAPLLEELSSEWFEPPNLLSFLQRSSCSLKKLALIRCRLPDDIITVLRNSPSVTELLLVMEYDEDEGDEDTFDQDQIALFSAMQIFGTPAGLCPNLTSFVFGYATSISAWDLFFAMAQSHFARHLTHLRIFNAGDSDNGTGYESERLQIASGGEDTVGSKIWAAGSGEFLMSFQRSGKSASGSK